MSATRPKKRLPKPVWVIGIDEVGRGPIAGPVTVCAVAMPLALYKKSQWKGLRDSKKMTPQAREVWFKQAKEMLTHGTIKVAVCSKSAPMIDKIGISSCIKKSIASLLKKIDLDPRDCLILLDGGLKAPAEYVNQQTIIKGDDKERIISLASVIAKVSRDLYMDRQHRVHPNYGWISNKGYGTTAHMAALKRVGITPLHRKSFLGKILDK